VNIFSHNFTATTAGALWGSHEVAGFGDACAMALPELFLTFCDLVMTGCLPPLTMMVTALYFFTVRKL